MSKIAVTSGDRVVFVAPDGSEAIIDFGPTRFNTFAPGIRDTLDIEPMMGPLPSVTVHVRRKREDE